MAQLRWIQMSLFAILVLHSTAITGQQPPLFTVRVEEEVTLPCENVIKNQVKCDSTTWLASQYAAGETVELVHLGKMNNWIPKAKSDTLSVTENCSLVLKNVTHEDAGRYTCRQHKSGNVQAPDTLVYLSVVTIIENQVDDTVLQTCTVLAYEGGCGHTAQWLYEGDVNNVNISPPHACSASVTFTTSGLNQRSKYYELLKCKVTDNKSGRAVLCSVGPQSSCEKTDQKGSTSEDQTATKQALLRFIIVSVGLATLIIIVVAVNIWTRTTGHKAQRDDNDVHHVGDEEDVTVNYENVGKHSAS